MLLVVHPAAQRELDAALQWSRAEFGRPVAARLLRRFDRAGELLMGQPMLGSPAEANARRLPLHGFPYTLVYRVEGAVVHVLALMHQSRLPDYWVGR
jgi:plasmid stabilization system protein ParE